MLISEALREGPDLRLQSLYLLCHVLEASLLLSISQLREVDLALRRNAFLCRQERGIVHVFIRGRHFTVLVGLEFGRTRFVDNAFQAAYAGLGQSFLEVVSGRNRRGGRLLIGKLQLSYGLIGEGRGRHRVESGGGGGKECGSIRHEDSLGCGTKSGLISIDH